MTPLKRPRYPLPDDVSSLLADRGLTEAYHARPDYQQNDYIGWIERAKRDSTRQRRISQMLRELESGDVYMGMAWKPSRTKGK